MGAKDIIEAYPESIGSLITFSSTPDTIIVPIYQRSYQWERSKVEDIMRLTDPDSRDFGFIGTMVFVKEKGPNLVVVDGQQRLISLVLVLCALRDFINEYIEKCDDMAIVKKLQEMSGDIQKENLVVSKSYSDDAAIPRLSFDRSSYEVFEKRYLIGNREFVPEEVKSRTELNCFQNNYQTALEYLRNKYPFTHGRNQDITALLNKRLNRLKSLVVNAIYVTDSMNAGEVFESINGTGITLKLSELVKNYVFRNLAGNSTQERWEQLETLCDNKPILIERVIKYDWQSGHDETDDFDIFRSIKLKEREVDQYLARLTRVSKLFAFYLHPSSENFKYLKIKDDRNDKNHIINFAVTLRTINAMQFLRLIIALNPVIDLISMSDYLKLLKAIHNFQVRAKVAGIASNDIDTLYSRHSKKLWAISEKLKDRGMTTKEAYQQIRQILQTDLIKDMMKMSPDEVFATGFINFSRTKSTGKDFFKYLLGSIENHLERNEHSIDVKDNQITLEEIYPQDPAEGWHVTDLGPEDIYRFGNATILKGKDNGAGSNKVITEKYPIYKRSVLTLNEDLVRIIDENHKEWVKNTILQRSKALAVVALKIWKI